MVAGMSTSIPDRMPLGDAINSATRSVHTKLNKLVLLRLPLALPPRAESPSAYISGLLHLAPIWITFESEWQRILNTSRSTTEPLEGPAMETKFFWGSVIASSEKQGPSNCERVRSILQCCHITGLQRTARLKSDLRALTGWPSSKVEQQLRAVAKIGHLSAFINHIQLTAEKRPHCLLAYAWVLYMAMFSGGRFIRASLESAGDHFWNELPTPIRPNLLACQHLDPSDEESDPEFTADECYHGRQRAVTSPSSRQSRQSRKYPLAFFHFRTPRDGEDLKQQFKQRLAEADGMLTPTERSQIVQEAGCIFDNIILMISQLDSVCETDLHEETSEGLASLLNPRGRFRDSIAISKERASRTAMAKEFASDDQGSHSSSSSQTSLSSDSVGQVESHIPSQVEHATAEHINNSPGIHWDHKVQLSDRHETGDSLSKSGPPTTDGPLDVSLDPEIRGVVVVKRRWPLSELSLADVVLIFVLLAVTIGVGYTRR